MLAKKRKTICASTILNSKGAENGFNDNSGAFNSSKERLNSEGLTANDSIDELEEDEEEESKTYHREDIQIRFILEPAEGEKKLKALEHKFVLCSEHTPVSVIKKVVCKQLGLASPNQVKWIVVRMTDKRNVGHLIQDSFDETFKMIVIFIHGD